MNETEPRSTDSSEQSAMPNDYAGLLQEARRRVRADAQADARGKAEARRGDPRFDPEARVEFLEKFELTGNRPADITRFLQGTRREQYLDSAAYYGNDIHDYLVEIVRVLQEEVNAKPGDARYHDVNEDDPNEDADMIRWLRQIPRLELATLQTLLGDEQTNQQPKAETLISKNQSQPR